MQKKHLVLGILAHVDAGKTTLSELLLYQCGMIRSMGRVDHGNAFLDTFELEKKRGITIFSKQAQLVTEKWKIALLDTPGHTDFSPETERSLHVMDYAVLVINAAEQLASQVRTLWKLLKYHHVPTFVFVNKMDLCENSKDEIIRMLQEHLSSHILDFTEQDDAFYEQIALQSDVLLEKYLSEEMISEEEIRKEISACRIFPCYFGAALKGEGTKELLAGIDCWMEEQAYPDAFGAYVYKITRDPQAGRLVWMKITGGSMKNRMEIPPYGKLNQIRIYSGERYESVQEVFRGQIAAVAGLSDIKAGERIGSDQTRVSEMLQPVMSAGVFSRDGTDSRKILQALRILEEEEPMLRVSCREDGEGEITIGIMGAIQMEVLKHQMLERFGYRIDFGSASIVYKETIANAVEGIGHFEPLRHYAEVHLVLERGEAGSGIVVESACSTDVLSANWQRQVLSVLSSEKLKGVLTGGELTDVKITLIAGRAHEKHTEGGDFRQAALRAVRQGLMQAECILLEPVYAYRLHVPSGVIGRAMSDIERMSGTMQSPEIRGDAAVIEGEIPSATLGNYQMELSSYTGGEGSMELSVKGYVPCHNAEEIVEQSAYDPETDLQHPSSSVFCAHGAGVVIPWQEVSSYMHIQTNWQAGITDMEKFDLRAQREAEEAATFAAAALKGKGRREDPVSFKEQELRRSAAEGELKEIFERTYRSGNFKKEKNDGSREQKTPYYAAGQNRRREAADRLYPERKKRKQSSREKEYLLVDGYNIIFAWDELAGLARVNLDAARETLQDILSDFQGVDGRCFIVVFDAYKVKGGTGSVFSYHNINIVFTKEAETADAYIEKTVHEMSREYQVSVATSDQLEQMIIMGKGARRISAAELKIMVEEARISLRESFLEKKQTQALQRLLDQADETTKEELEQLRLGKEQ